MINLNDQQFYRALLALSGSFRSNWNWSVDYSYTNTDVDQSITNDTSISRVRQGLLVDPVTGECFDPSSGCVSVNPFGAESLTPAAADFIGLDTINSDSLSEEQIVNWTIRGPLLEYSAGARDVAVGLEYRRTSQAFLPGQAVVDGDSAFLGSTNPFEGNTNVLEVFGEARVPLVSDRAWAEYLGLELGVRASEYNVLDDTVWTWKVGAEWTMRNGLGLRVMAQRAIRVAALAERGQMPGPPFVDFFLGPNLDPCSASLDPVGSGIADLCVAQDGALPEVEVERGLRRIRSGSSKRTSSRPT